MAESPLPENTLFRYSCKIPVETAQTHQSPAKQQESTAPAKQEAQRSEEEKAKEVQKLQALAGNLSKSDVTTQNAVRRLAKVLDENIDTWKTNFPEWLATITAELEDHERHIDSTQLQEFLHALIKYLRVECWASLSCFKAVVRLDEAQRLLLPEEDFYNITKKGFHTLDDVYTVLYNIMGSDAWILKILQDKPFILEMLAYPENVDIWDIFAIMALHPDAKELLPKKEVIEKAMKSTYIRCTDICALLCSEDDLKVLKIETKWKDELSALLRARLKGKTPVRDKITYTIKELIHPIVNLSIVDSQKDILGKQFVPLLVQAEELLRNDPHPRLPIRREIARALWNFAYTEANRELMKDKLESLKKSLSSATDAVLKQNLNGILHMFTEPTKVEHQIEADKKGHIMISYNWGNQPIVKRLAKALQDRGLKVWLDIEQMGGSTLEAMAKAVEGSELVLICMSQKYKDSPNCRLEGEYCVNRKVSFIPLMMQQGYRPDGWLGIALGSKLYYDFTDESNWDDKMIDLIKGMTGMTKLAPSLPAPIADVPQKKSIANMSSEDIHEWMKASKIEHLHTEFAQHRVTGTALAEFKHLLVQDPSFFLRICEYMGFRTVGDILELSSALRKL